MVATVHITFFPVDKHRIVRSLEHQTSLCHAAGTVKRVQIMCIWLRVRSPTLEFLRTRQMHFGQPNQQRQSTEGEFLAAVS